MNPITSISTISIDQIDSDRKIEMIALFGFYQIAKSGGTVGSTKGYYTLGEGGKEGGSLHCRGGSLARGPFFPFL